MRIILLIVLVVFICLCVRLCYGDTGILLNKAVIHHTASHEVSAKTIDEWHKARGWKGIGYNFGILIS